MVPGSRGSSTSTTTWSSRRTSGSRGCPRATARRARGSCCSRRRAALVDGVWVERPGPTALAAWWHYEDHLYQLRLMIACPGLKPEEVKPIGVTFDEIALGCWDPKARLADMDKNHVEASLCFPNYPRFCGQLFNERKDRELAKLCVEAYNDWMVEEWCGGSNGRLIPLCIVPLWDAELAAAEIRRNAARGVRAVAFSELPAWLGLPSLHTDYWNPFIRACEETGTVICMHIGSGTKTVSTSRRRADDHVLATDRLQQRRLDARLDLLGQARAVPEPEDPVRRVPDRLDPVLRRTRRRHLADPSMGAERVPPARAAVALLPPEIYSCFFKDTVGVDLIERVGLDQVMFETDYPHQDGTLPNTRQAAATHVRPPRPRPSITRSRAATPSSCSASISCSAASPAWGLYEHRAR